MSANKKKAVVISREYAEFLRRRLASTFVVTEGYDASNNPQITVNDGTPIAGEQNVYIRILEMPVLGTNSVGIAADSYGPHIIQVATEATVASAAVSLVTEANKSVVLAGALTTGARVEVYVGANATAPSVATIAAGNLVQTIDSDLMFGVFAGT